jgi:hypothetical protein
MASRFGVVQQHAMMHLKLLWWTDVDALLCENEQLCV